MCRRKKNRRKKNVLVDLTHGHASRKQTKRIIHAGAAKKKMSKQTDSESSKNIYPGEKLQAGVKGRATTEMSTLLGERPAPAAM